MSVSIKVEWQNEITLEHLNTKVSSLAYSLNKDYVDNSKEILDKILKDDDCEIPSDDDQVVDASRLKKIQNYLHE